MQRLERDLGDLQHDPHAEQVGTAHLQHAPTTQLGDEMLQPAAERPARRWLVAAGDLVRGQRHDVGDHRPGIVADMDDVMPVVGRAAEQFAQLAQRRLQPGVAVDVAGESGVTKFGLRDRVLWTRSEQQQHCQLVGRERPAAARTGRNGGVGPDDPIAKPEPAPDVGGFHVSRAR